jgi:hypothetical protein
VLEVVDGHEAHEYFGLFILIISLVLVLGSFKVINQTLWLIRIFVQMNTNLVHAQVGGHTWVLSVDLLCDRPSVGPEHYLLLSHNGLEHLEVDTLGVGFQAQHSDVAHFFDHVGFCHVCIFFCCCGGLFQ